ncbi:unnamed protein product [Calypogeia fissa]
MASLDENEQWQGRQQTAELNNNIVFEVLRRVDAVTLAAASCVSRNFRSVAEEEDLWEKLCNDRWPSTKDSEVKSVLSSVGGYRRMYAHCYPSIINNKQSFVSKDDHHDRLGYEKASDFFSIVDVVYLDKSLLSRIVDGIPGAEDCRGWYSTCPFRTDLLTLSGNEYRDQGENGNMIEIDLPYSAVSRFSGGLKNGTSSRNGARVWKMLCDNIRVSWILINKKTKRMANLASWKTQGGFRHWLCNEDFLMRFGSVLPGSPAISDSSVGGGPVQCNISLVCSLNVLDLAEVPGETVKATLRLSELSLQLEDFEGSLATGQESIAILHRALSCPRSRHCGRVADSYQRYLKVRNESKARNLKYDGQLNVTAAVASGISSCLFVFWLFNY